MVLGQWGRHCAGVGHRHRGLDDLKALAEERWPAWPALVNIGESDGASILFNLEHAGFALG